jgi:hypothetical protein
MEDDLRMLATGVTNAGRILADALEEAERQCDEALQQLHAAGDGYTWKEAHGRLEAQLAKRTAERDEAREQLAAIRAHYEFGVSEETAISNVWWQKMTRLVEGPEE